MAYMCTQIEMTGVQVKEENAGSDEEDTVEGQVLFFFSICKKHDLVVIASLKVRTKM